MVQVRLRLYQTSEKALPPLCEILATRQSTMMNKSRSNFFDVFFYVLL